MFTPTAEQAQILRSLIEHVTDVRYRQRLTSGQEIRITLPDAPDFHWIPAVAANMVSFRFVTFEFRPVE